MTRLRLVLRRTHRVTPLRDTHANELELPPAFRRKRHLSLVPDLSAYDPAEKTIRDRLRALGVRL